MSNSQIRRRAREIIFGSTGMFIVIALIPYIVNLISQKLSERSIFLTIAFRVISSVLSIAFACFYFRAYNKGKPDFSDLYTLFTECREKSKILKLILIQYVLNILLLIFSNIMAALGGFFSFASIFLVVIASALINMLPYLYISNPDYPMEFYLKRLSAYLMPEIARYIIFVFITALPLRFLLVIVALFLAFLLIIGPLMIIALSLLYSSYVGLATAGFISSIIPDEWYAGTRIF